MRAFHEGGQVNIEIVDDGAGLKLDRIRQKAIEKGLITAEQAGRMSDREAGQLIFAPGFSTAEKVTSVSGRGVGGLTEPADVLDMGNSGTAARLLAGILDDFQDALDRFPGGDADVDVPDGGAGDDVCPL